MSLHSKIVLKVKGCYLSPHHHSYHSFTTYVENYGNNVNNNSRRPSSHCVRYLPSDTISIKLYTSLIFNDRQFMTFVSFDKYLEILCVVAMIFSGQKSLAPEVRKTTIDEIRLSFNQLPTVITIPWFMTYLICWVEVLHTISRFVGRPSLYCRHPETQESN
jgi:hypothetical protein